jgi:hypothetical protein
MERGRESTFKWTAAAGPLGRRCVGVVSRSHDISVLPTFCIQNGFKTTFLLQESARRGLCYVTKAGFQDIWVTRQENPRTD